MQVLVLILDISCISLKRELLLTLEYNLAIILFGDNETWPPPRRAIFYCRHLGSQIYRAHCGRIFYAQYDFLKFYLKIFTAFLFELKTQYPLQKLSFYCVPCFFWLSKKNVKTNIVTKFFFRFSTTFVGHNLKLQQIDICVKLERRILGNLTIQIIRQSYFIIF